MERLSIFVSSPGDVAEERIIARRVISRLQAEFGERLELDAVFWEQEPLLASASFQDQLPKPSDSDVAVCILWARLGTPLPITFRKADGSRYGSGTEFEFEDALAGFRSRGKPDLLVYRKTAPPLIPGDDDVLAVEKLRQKQAVDLFMRRWFHNEADGTLLAAFHPFASASDFEEILEAHLRKLIARHCPDAVGASRESSVSWQHGSPFRGLEAFEGVHAPVFFGRTAAVTDMIAALRRQDSQGKPFLLVLGSSGCGKSSVVRAGLVPLLVQPGVIEGVKHWLHAAMKPHDAAGNLVGALADLLSASGALDEPAARALEPVLRNTEAAHHEQLLRVLADSLQPASRVVLLVDQLEEVFTDEQVTEEERAAFFRALSLLVRSRCIWIVATLRSDFYPRCTDYAELVDLKADTGQYDLRLPTAAEIGQIVRLPAAAAGLRFEIRPDRGERLDEVLRDEAVASPEALPLLEFALEELYQRRSSDGTLTFSAYREIGGVEGALGRRAEHVFNNLDAQAQSALPEVLRLLVNAPLDDSESAGRRQAPLAAFSRESQPLVTALIAARLCVSELDASGQPVVSIAHEALLRHWPRASEWVASNQETLRSLARLAAATSRWLQEGRSADLLLAAGKPLEEAMGVVSSGAQLGEAERALLAASTDRARRNRRLRTSAVAALAVLAILASIAALVANNERNRATTEASTTQQTMEFMVSMFTVADPSSGAGNNITVREILDNAAERVEQGLDEQPVVRASLMTAMGRAYTGLGLHEPARRLLTSALSERERLAGETARPTTEARSALAAALYLEGRYTEAEQAFRRTLADARRTMPESDALVSQSLNGLALTLYQQGNTDEAEQLYREALEIDLRLHGREHPDTARTLKGLGMSLYFAGRYAEAEPLLAEALDLYSRLLGESTMPVAEARNDLGSLFYQQGRYAEAAIMLQSAYDTYRHVLGADHPDLASIGNNIGRSLLMEGRLAAAEQQLRDSLALDRRSKPEGHDDYALPLNSLGMIELARANLVAAERYLAEALAICRTHELWLLDQVLLNTAELQARQGDVTAARAALTEARAVLAEQYPLDQMPAEAWRYALHDRVMALILTREREFEAAERLLAASLPVIEKRFGTGRFYTRSMHDAFAGLYREWGRQALATRHQQAAAR